MYEPQEEGEYPGSKLIPILLLWAFSPSGMVYEEEEEISPDLWQEACWIVIRLDGSGEAGKCSKVVLKIWFKLVLKTMNRSCENSCAVATYSHSLAWSWIWPHDTSTV